MFDMIFYSFILMSGGLIVYYLLNKSFKLGGSVFHPLPITTLILGWSMVGSPILSWVTGNYLFLSPFNIDFEYWNKVTSFVYFVLLVAFFIGVGIGVCVTRKKKRIWTFDRGKTFLLGSFFLFSSFLLQLYVYASMGGFSGYLTSWTTNKDEFDGLGPIFIVSESFPVLALFLFTMLSNREKVARSTIILFALFLLFFLMKLYFGGFRGSRSNTIWGLYWFAGIVHLYWRPLRLRHYIIGVAFLMTFMLSYSVYKTYGIDSFTFEYSIEDTGRFSDSNPLIDILQGDFSRAGIHSMLLSRYYTDDNYELKLGQTYVHSALLLLPIINKPSWLYSKGAAGYELFYGGDVNISNGRMQFHNSRIYGLYGEGILNFGPVLPILLFVVMGYFIARIDNWCRSLDPSDIRYFLIPFIANMSLVVFLADSSNFIFLLMKNGLMLFVLIMFIRKVKRINVE